MTKAGRGGPTERRLQVLAAKARPGGYQPPCCSLACGGPGLAGWCPLRGGPGDLDDHELVQAAEAQCDLAARRQSKISTAHPGAPTSASRRAAEAGNHCVRNSPRKALSPRGRVAQCLKRHRGDARYCRE